VYPTMKKVTRSSAKREVICFIIRSLRRARVECLLNSEVDMGGVEGVWDGTSARPQLLTYFGRIFWNIGPKFEEKL
jgi:hypothetical protein